MKAGKKTPWARYITIFLFLAMVGAVIMGQRQTRVRAQSSNAGAEVEYFNGDESVEVETVVTGNDVFPGGDEKEFATVVESGIECNEVGAACSANIDTQNKIYVWLYSLIGTPNGTTTMTGADAGGAIGQTTKLIAATYRQPAASGAYYVADAMQSMGLAEPTYAQGYGYYALAPFLQLWRMFRNMVYMIFAIMIIVIAMMILFRQRTGSQAAITAQQALPRIVIALVLVTFSYAIAGFMVDIMYWLMYVVGAYIKINAGTTFSGDTEVTKAMLINASFKDLASIMLAGQFTAVWKGVSDMVNSFLGAKDNDWLTKTVSWATGGIVSLIFMIALLFSLFRLLFILLKSYAAFLLYTLFSPFFLMVHAIPGTNSFTSWIKKIIGNLAPFVIVFIMIVMVGLMNHYTSGQNVTGFVPPYLTSGEGGATLQTAGMIVGFAIMLAMPEIVSTLKQKLAGGPGFFEQMANAAGGRFAQSGGAYVMGGIRANTLGRAQRAMEWGGNELKAQTMGRGLAMWENMRQRGQIAENADAALDVEKTRRSNAVQEAKARSQEVSGKVQAILSQDEKLSDLQGKKVGIETSMKNKQELDNESNKKLRGEIEAEKLRYKKLNMNFDEDDFVAQKRGYKNWNDAKNNGYNSSSELKNEIVGQYTEDRMSQLTQQSKDLENAIKQRTDEVRQERHEELEKIDNEINEANAALTKALADEDEIINNADAVRQRMIQNQTQILKDLNGVHFVNAVRQGGVDRAAGEIISNMNFRTRRNAYEQAYSNQAFNANHRRVWNIEHGKDVNDMSDNPEYRPKDVDMVRNLAAVIGSRQ